MKTKFRALILAVIIILSQIKVELIVVQAAAGARSATSGNDVFLGGNYIEVGVSKIGSFGSFASAPSGFHPTRRTSVGLTVDGDGWDTGSNPVVGDFFLPGSPEERFILGYKIGSATYNNNAAERSGQNWPDPIQALSTVDQSDVAAGKLKAVTTGITKENIKLTQVVEFTTNDKFFKTTITVENLSQVTLDSLRYVRSFDPDQDADLSESFATYGKVISNPRVGETGDQVAMVVARGSVTLSPFFFISYDHRARASAFVSFSPNDAYMAGLWTDNTNIPTTVTDGYYELSQSDISSGTFNGYTIEDNGIAITFELGSLAAGGSTTFEFYSSLDPNVASSMSSIQASTQSAFSDLTYSAADFTVTSSVSGTGYFIVVADGSTAPTASQIKAGIDYNSPAIKVFDSGSAGLTANLSHIFELADLTQGGTYKVYFVTEYDDNGTSTFSSITSGTFTTVSYGSPLLTPTSSATNITTTSATLSGEVTSDNSEGTKPVTDRGICYSTTTNPDSNNGTCISLGTGTGSFSTSVTGLSPNTTYYVRAYATNEYGTRYATQSSFTTLAIKLSTTLNLTLPKIGADQPSTFSGTGYTASVTWSPAESDGKFHANQSYVATISITPSAGYTLSGISANSFTLEGASVVHSANSGNIVATYASLAQKTLTYHSNGGSSVSGGLVNVGANIAEPAQPSRNGYRFVGWYSDINDQDLYSFNGAVMPNMDLNLYAKWELESYSISYDYAGGTGTNPSSYTINDAIVFGVPVREGYRFDGWSPISSISAGSTGNVSVSALWTFVPRTPVIGGLSIENLGSDSASISASVLDYGNPKLNAFRYELINLDTGDVITGFLGSGLSVNLTGLNPYTHYAIKVMASNGLNTYTYESTSFTPKLLDSDNDGIPDVRDAFPEDSTKSFDVTEISPDREPKRVLMGTIDSSQTQQYQLKITPKDLMGLERTDNILIIMGSVQFSIPVAMVDTILANTDGEDAWLTLKVEPQIVEESFDQNILDQEDMNLIAAYDYLLFQVYSDGRETPIHQLGGKIKVGIGLGQLQGEYDPTKMEVYFYDSETGLIESMKAVYDPATQSMIFLTEHFSYYVLGVKKENDPTQTTLQVLFLGIAIGMAIVGFVWRLLGRKKKEARNA